MRILLMSLGTRGDCEPFLGVGEWLRQMGDEVVCAFEEQHRCFTEEAGFPFYSLGSEFLGLIDSDNGRKAMSGNGAEKMFATVQLAKKSLPIQKKLLYSQRDVIEEVKPDCVICHPKITYPLLWSLSGGGKTVMLSPIPCFLHEIEGYPPVGINKNLGRTGNSIGYRVVKKALVSAFYFGSKTMFAGRISKRNIRTGLEALPVFYTVSPSVVPQPRSWGKQVMMAGFWERDKQKHWHAPRKLEDFLQAHERVLLVTFGSMVNKYPEKTTLLFLSALKNLGIPAVLNISGGGLIEPKKYDKKQFMFTQSVPYDWAFQRMYGVVCHGGAGTIHSALKMGCAVMAVPHTADQPLWNDILYKLGVGPKGVPISKIQQHKLQELLSDFVGNEKYKRKAEQVADAMRNEAYKEPLYKLITGEKE